MSNHLLITFVVSNLVLSICNGQSNYELYTYKGTVFKFNHRQATKGLGDHILDFKEIGKFECEEINFQIQDMETSFPEIDETVKFAIEFRNVLTINKTGCYEFSLKSDDGSLLYINDELTLDNNGRNQRIGSRSEVR